MSSSNGNLPGFSFKRSLTRMGASPSNISTQSGASTKSSGKSSASPLARIGSFLKVGKGKQKATEDDFDYATPVKGGDDVTTLNYHLSKIVHQNHLHEFYDDKTIRELAVALAKNKAVDKIRWKWRLREEVALDFTALALYDIVLLLDDSGSMIIDERNKQLAEFCRDITVAASLFDQNGFSIRWLNEGKPKDDVVDPDVAAKIVKKTVMMGGTPLVQRFHETLAEFVYGPWKAGKLTKPVQIIIITDGRPTDNSGKLFQSSLRELYSHFNHAPAQGATANRSVVVQIAQVGDDEKATAFLSAVDSDKTYGDIVDVTSSFEIERKQAYDLSKSGEAPFYLSQQLWLCKLLMGAINGAYDSLDEASAWGSSKPPIIALRENQHLKDEEEKDKRIEALQKQLAEAGQAESPKTPEDAPPAYSAS